MAKTRNRTGIAIGCAVLVVYFFAAPRQIPPETVLVPRWIRSLDSGEPWDFRAPPGAGGGAQAPMPFRLDSRFGYIDEAGLFQARETGGTELAISRDFWSLRERNGASELYDPEGTVLARIPPGGRWPFSLGGRIFLLGEELESLAEIDAEGNTLWETDFAAPLADIDVAAGLVLAGFLDGTVEIYDGLGQRVFFFEPGGSRLSVICACRLSADGSRIAVISGCDDQRFLLLEKSGDVWKVAYHEFLSRGFRRKVRMAFVDGGRRIAFEREGGVAIYDTVTKRMSRVEMEGRIVALEDYGAENMFFAVTSQSETRKELAGIRYPGILMMEAPFRSAHVFLGRDGNRLYLGGGSNIAAFILERK